MYEIINKLHRIAELEYDGGIEEIAYELEDLIDDMILDVSNFKRELSRQGFLTKDLENFIADYMRWDNA